MREGAGLHRFALWCALVERLGLPWQDWPAPLRRPESAATAEERIELADRIDFHCWLQLLCDEQLTAAAATARALAMPVGVIHDLAVGVDPGGADAWSLQDDLFASGVSVGAPADAFNQQGQDWRQPPWRPDRLAADGYAPYRAMLRSILRHAGGVRIDHVLGLFRLWWIPEGARPSDGTYVRYDADAMLGIMTLEAHRSGALVIGEDLGTVEPGVRAPLADRGLLGSTLLWFETDKEGRPVPPERWRELTLATVTTHDLPTVTGLLALRTSTCGPGSASSTGRSRRSAPRRRDARRLAGTRSRARAAPTTTRRRTSELLALHALLAQSPCRLVAVGLADLIGDPRQPNQPGTVDAYPNWCLPLARPGASGRVEPVLLDEALADARAAQLVQLLTVG